MSSEDSDRASTPDFSEVRTTLFHSESEADPLLKAPTRADPLSSTVPHICSICHRLLGDEVFTQCTVCRGLVQCLWCFSNGAATATHSPFHPYILIETSPPPIFESGWSTEEDLLVVAGLELYGFGNWSELSRWLKTKSALQCEVHYCEVYLRNCAAPKPVMDLRGPFPLPPPLPFDTRPSESCPSCGHEKNLQSSNKKERSTPAEVNGYMPRRGEFEEEYNDDMEHIVDGLVFEDDRETQETFDQKVSSLLCFNAQLQERKMRTFVVEEWQLQYGKYREWQTALGGTTPTEREIDAKLLTLSPYIGRRKVEALARRLHDLSRDIEGIECRQQWQRSGVKSQPEGELMKSLEVIVRDGKVPEGEWQRWNRVIAEYMAKHGAAESEDGKLLSTREVELCKREEIAPPMFVALKDLMMRELAVRSALSREEAAGLVPEESRKVVAMYDLFVSLGWVRF
jgi:transcriptional adapter 2-alpha